ncbi:hypothetical protein HGA64_02135 [Candidatus Falkowbacteria bacterium]|nr:hypothetical protein [Candidatus Falkowbacteria bacterium]
MSKKFFLAFALMLVLTTALFGCAKKGIVRPESNSNVSSSTTIKNKGGATINGEALTSSGDVNIGNKDATSSKMLKNTTSTVESVKIKGWEKYRNDKYGFELNYPKEWGTPNKEKDGRIVFKNKDCVAEYECPGITFANCSVENKKYDSYANIFVSIEEGCKFNYSKEFILSDSKCIFIQTGKIYDLINEDKCMRLINSIDQSRKTIYSSAQSVNLRNDEIPTEEVNAKNIFNKVVESFKKL